MEDEIRIRRPKTPSKKIARKEEGTSESGNLRLVFILGSSMFGLMLVSVILYLIFSAGDRVAPQEAVAPQPAPGNIANNAPQQPPAIPVENLDQPPVAEAVQPAGDQVNILGRHEGGVVVVAALAENKALSTGSDGAIRIWDLRTKRELKRELQRLRLPDERGVSVFRLSVAPGSSHFLVAGVTSRAVHYWKLGDNAPTATFDNPTEFVVAMEGNKMALDKRGQPMTVERSVLVFDFAWHPDGTHALISQSDGIWRWEPTTGQRKRLFAFSASAGYDEISEQRFAIASLTDPSGKSHDMGHKSLFRTAQIGPGTELVLTMFRDAFSPLTISPSGKRAVIANQVWNPADWNEPGIPLWQSEGSDRVIAKFAQDNHVCVARDRILQIFELTSGRLAAQAVSEAMITSLDVSADGQRALTGDILGHVRLWDLGQRKVVAKFEGHLQTVTAVVFTPDESHALSGGQDRTVRLWELPKPADAPTPLPVAPLIQAEPGKIGPMPANAAMPQLADAPPFAAAKRLSSLPTVQVQVTADGARALLRIPDRSSPSDTKVIRGLPGARIKEKVIVGLGGPPVPGAVEVWDIKNNERMGGFEKPAIVGATLSADGSRVLIVRGGFLPIGNNASELMQVWNVEKQTFANDPAPWTAQEKYVMENLYIDSSGGTPLSAYDNFTRIFAAKDKSLYIIDASELASDSTGKPRKNAPSRIRRKDNPSAHGSIYSVLSQSKSDLIVVRWNDGLIDVLQGKTEKLVAEYNTQGWPVSLTADGRFLLTIETDNNYGAERQTTVRLCQTTDGQELATFKLNGEHTQAVALLPHARYALIGHTEGSIGLWDLNEAKLIGRMREQSQPTRQIVISADGKHALSAGLGGAWHFDLSAVQEPPPRELLPKKPASSKPKNAAVKPTKKK